MTRRRRKRQLYRRLLQALHRPPYVLYVWPDSSPMESLAGSREVFDPAGIALTGEIGRYEIFRFICSTYLTQGQA